MKANSSEKPLTIFVCGKSNCCKKGGDKVRSKLKAAIKEAGLKREIRVVESGCLDECKNGPAVMLCPANLVFSEVRPGDVDELLEVAAAEYLSPV
ncbi:MAG: (2Fe-2S) ferredoxin domain-containing protein [Candidatus Sumerlaeia bacterium]|nr:(2Fe-2S) ferredoxin domain-containing protein [Candidatus Sumerlaeia bacterium]